MLDENTLNHLEELAKNATQGEWSIDTGGLGNVYDITTFQEHIVFAGYDHDDCIEFGIKEKKNAQYITAVQPKVVLSLIDEIRRLKNRQNTY